MLCQTQHIPNHTPLLYTYICGRKDVIHTCINRRRNLYSFLYKEHQVKISTGRGIVVRQCVKMFRFNVVQAIQLSESKLKQHFSLALTFSANLSNLEKNPREVRPKRRNAQSERLSVCLFSILPSFLADRLYSPW